MAPANVEHRCNTRDARGLAPALGPVNIWQNLAFFIDCDADGFSRGIGVPGRRKNASFNPITLKYIGFQGEIAHAAGDSSGSIMLRNVDSEH
jgi:hypothetical protein